MVAAVTARGERHAGAGSRVAVPVADAVAWVVGTASGCSRQVAGPRFAAARAPLPFSPPHGGRVGGTWRRPGRRSEEVRRQREAHVSAEQPQAGQAPRISAPDVDPGRTGHHQVPSRQGPGSPLGVIWRIRDRAVFARFRRDGRRARVGSLWMSVIADPAAAAAEGGLRRRSGGRERARAQPRPAPAAGLAHTRRRGAGPRAGTWSVRRRDASFTELAFHHAGTGLPRRARDSRGRPAAEVHVVKPGPADQRPDAPHRLVPGRPPGPTFTVPVRPLLLDLRPRGASRPTARSRERSSHCAGSLRCHPWGGHGFDPVPPPPSAHLERVDRRV